MSKDYNYKLSVKGILGFLIFLVGQHIVNGMELQW